MTEIIHWPLRYYCRFVKATVLASQGSLMLSDRCIYKKFTKNVKKNFNHSMLVKEQVAGCCCPAYYRVFWKKKCSGSFFFFFLSSSYKFMMLGHPLQHAMYWNFWNIDTGNQPVTLLITALSAWQEVEISSIFNSKITSGAESSWESVYQTQRQDQ